MKKILILTALILALPAQAELYRPSLASAI